MVGVGDKRASKDSVTLKEDNNSLVQQTTRIDQTFHHITKPVHFVQQLLQHVDELSAGNKRQIIDCCKYIKC